ncbi:helix-turn-helix domain-containing protein [Paraburkholderia tropica]|uniref:helix-turn-helix domain-containing protein n=1 Tax=Paraburkholderia tropica TaxID=92647 RepID=UPI002AB01F3D|nr:helix-turn-helix domain-containing protein [Paraburkholderia tropica]
MSFHLINLAWHRDLRATQKIVLIALADFAQQTTGECNPSVRVLSAKCGLSASAVRKQIKALQAARLVDVISREGGVAYRVLLGALA